MVMIILLFILIALLTYLIILGSNASKTEEERKIEDQEQIEYLEKWRKRKNEYK